ncbi:hypothetical protein Lalb_Chr23g0278361 [Lupinus albus]|uniref:Uncharacterized protein n=1 Tax=Lupinus albus TaxID=3870 RepID=A0A6A4NJZ1_LUPAL|nr:hypothetical protein Lalb_Chr23g0278361 [Lupinus albus]
MFDGEKHSEKKHKKKDKEKESKEKRDKEGRCKDKKDKKEKHRENKKDKDKDKERDKDKSKVNTTDEKGFQGQTQVPNEGKLHQKEITQNDKKGVLFEDKLINGEKARKNNHPSEEKNKDSKFLMEFDRRIKDNGGGIRHQLVQKFTIADHRKDGRNVKLVSECIDGKEKLLDKGINARTIDGRGTWTETRPIGNAAFQNHGGNLQPLEKNFDRTLFEATTVEGKKRVKEKKDDDVKRGDKKKKDRDKEKKGHGKDKDVDKEKKKKEEKVKELNSEHKNREQNNKLKENNKTSLIGLNSFTQVAARYSNENSFLGENLKKRKDIDSNGVLDANDNVPSKFPRSSTSHIFTENGRILEACQISLPNGSDKPGEAATNVKVDHKEHKINGAIEAIAPAATTLPAYPKAEASAKPPHPDTKCLSQVYLVPKTEEWSGFDDQEWLFSNSCSQERKPAAKSSEVGDNTLHVWAEAVHIESADVIALPYVIPY